MLRGGPLGRAIIRVLTNNLCKSNSNTSVPGDAQLVSNAKQTALIYLNGKVSKALLLSSDSLPSVR